MSLSSRNLIRGAANIQSFADTLRPVTEEMLRSPSQFGSKTRNALEQVRIAAQSEGYIEGLRQGEEVGLARGLAESQRQFEEAHAGLIEEFAAKLNEFVDETEASLQDWYRAAESRLAVLATEIARRAIRRELENSRESILEIAKQALSEVSPGSRVRIRCNPWDGSILESRRDELTSALVGVRGLEIVEDGSLTGGCIVETDGGVVDASVDGYLERLSDAA